MMTITLSKKFLGQNFLVSGEVINDLVSAVRIRATESVLEIGAGEGAVTKELARRAERVIAVEIDRDLIPILKENLRGFSNVAIINQDILKFEISNLEFRIDKVVGSIPYRITSPLIHKLVIERPRPELAVLLIQKEVAQKVAARSPKATYLSNLIQVAYRTEIVRTVDRRAFLPPPKVEGAIVKFERKSEKKIDDLEDFSKFLHKGFSHPRKMLNKVFERGDLKKAGIDATFRPEALSLKEWFGLYDILKQEDAELSATHCPIKSLG